MRILSWNIQSGLGCDGIRDIERTVSYINANDPPDVICLQEVARFIPEYCTAGQADQLQLIADGLSGYNPVWGTGMRWGQPEKPAQEFGNLTLTRSPILDSRVYPLPMPPPNGKPQLPRIATEVTLPTANGPLRLQNAHIAFHNRDETRLQVEYICRLQEWAERSKAHPPARRGGAYANRFRTDAAILCGDLNFTPQDPCYAALADSRFSDSWCLRHPRRQHQPTCGVFDTDTWPDGPHCRDYFWISSSLAPLVSDIQVDLRVNLSDHQPVTLDLDLELLIHLDGEKT